MELRFLFFASLLEIGKCQEYKCGDASQLTQWCTSQNGTLQTDKNSTSCFSEKSLIGISVAFCGAKSVEGIALGELKFLDFRNQPDQKCPYGDDMISNIGDLYGAMKLENVLMGKSCGCPGKVDVRNETFIPWDNIDPGVTNDWTSCFGQKSFCTASEEKPFNGYECPENSACQDQGPALFDCQCTDGHIGYRCTEVPGFPFAIVFTVAPILALLVTVPVWYIGRRNIVRYDQL